MHDYAIVTPTTAHIIRCNACTYQRVMHQVPGEPDADYSTRLTDAAMQHEARHIEKATLARPAGVTDEQWAETTELARRLRGRD